MQNLERLIQDVGSQLGDAGAMRWLFPLLTVVGPGVLLYYGVQGIWKKSTIVGYRYDQRLVVNKVTGNLAIVVGGVQLLAALLVLAVMAPISAAILGLW